MFLSPIYPFPMLHLLEKWKKKEVQKGMSDSEEKNQNLLETKRFIKGVKRMVIGNVSEHTLVD